MDEFNMESSAPPRIRIVDPALDQLESLRQPLTKGERAVLDWLLTILPLSWEIYVQPHLNGLRPDFVLLHPKNGIAVYEVKDWSLQGMDYFVETGSRGPKLMGRRDGKTFSLASSDPVAKIDLYKQEIYGLYVPSLPAGNGYRSIVAGIIFTQVSTEEAVELLAPLRKRRDHEKYSKWYPVIGSELIGQTDKTTLRQLLNSANKTDPEMGKRVAAELRHWLVEPSFSSEQRVPLKKLMTPRQRSLCLNEESARFRRIKGPAGSGKSLIIAGRAAELAGQGKRVLVVTFNITLINYLSDLAVQYSQSGKVRKQITTLNFHLWCRRIAVLTGNDEEYAQLWSGKDDQGTARQVLEFDLPAKALGWAASLDDHDRWDAVLVDEAQDFMPGWWGALRAALPRDGSGEALICADRQQNIYGVEPWTETVMNGAGFRGRWATLDQSFRLSPALCRLASAYIEEFLPDSEAHRPNSAAGEFEFRTVLRWRQIEHGSQAAEACVQALLEILDESAGDPVAVSDLVCIVDSDSVGKEIVLRLREKNIRAIDTFGHSADRRESEEESRRKKQAFYKGDARVKVTTIQSFKGWESKALVVLVTRAIGPKDLALAYTAITRLKRDDRGCYLTVVCSAPGLSAFGRKWAAM
jgi:hypothetical protein